MYQPTEPAGEKPETVAVHVALPPAVMEMGSQLTTVVVENAVTPSENVPELARFFESPE